MSLRGCGGGCSRSPGCSELRGSVQEVQQVSSSAGTQDSILNFCTLRGGHQLHPGVRHPQHQGSSLGCKMEQGEEQDGESSSHLVIQAQLPAVPAAGRWENELQGGNCFG